MSTYDTKEVRFDIWCPTCLYLDVDDTKGNSPCNECLEISARFYSTKPEKYKEDSRKVSKS